MGESILYEEQLHAIIDLYFPMEGDEEAREKAIELWAIQQRINIELNEINPTISLENQIQAEQELMMLNLFELENKYIEKNIDTTVTEEEIQTYYDIHRDSYKTQSFIVRALYIKVPDTIVSVSKIEDYYLLKNDKDLEEIKKYANLYATNYYYEDKRWIFFDDLVREVPMSDEQKRDLIINQREAKYSGNGYTHFINILDSKTKSVSAPLDSERDVIKRHVLTRKINKLRENAKETIIEDVKKKYPITYH